MTQNSNPFGSQTQAFFQACCAPFAAQTAYWQTMQNIMQQRFRTLQQMSDTTATALQGIAQCGNPSDTAAICSAWWGIQTKTLANLNADTQSAQAHLWEQWQKSFPQLDRSVWTQQFTAWQNACSQGKSYVASAMQQVQQSVSSATESSSQSSTPVVKVMKSFPLFTYSQPKTATTSTYSQPKGTFIPAGTKASSSSQQTYAAGPTAPGTAPRGVATAATPTTKATRNVTADTQISSSSISSKATTSAQTALADNTVPLPKTKTATVTQSAGKPFAQQGEISAPVTTTQEDADNVTSLTGRTRMTGTNHTASLAAATSVRRSVVARRATKVRRVAR